MKILIRATQNKQRGRMRPAGRQFDMPALTLQRMRQFHDNQITSTTDKRLV
jgi:hypothetical protein